MWLGVHQRRTLAAATGRDPAAVAGRTMAVVTGQKPAAVAGRTLAATTGRTLAATTGRTLTVVGYIQNDTTGTAIYSSSFFGLLRLAAAATARISADTATATLSFCRFAAACFAAPRIWFLRSAAATSVSLILVSALFSSAANLYPHNNKQHDIIQILLFINHYNIET